MIEIPGVDHELTADIAEQRLGVKKAELAKNFIDTFTSLEVAKESELKRHLNEEELEIILRNAKQAVQGGYEALCLHESLQDIAEFELSNF